MKVVIKKIIAATADYSVAQRVYQACGVLGRHLSQIRGHADFVRENTHLDHELVALARELFPELQVQSGPFRGLQYPSLQSAGSALLPKLLGSYESELHPFISEISTNQYDAIVDIGCAEGYYAVGAALLWPKTIVYAFDIDSSARGACIQMAQLNDVGSRVRVAGPCDEKTMQSVQLGKRALIISDCEGYEKTLFTERLVSQLSRHDFLIETHDFINIETSSELKRIFSKTHKIRSVLSVDDIQKVHLYQHRLLDRLSKPQRRLVLNERRPAIMEWLVLTPSVSIAD
jgi:precorrin-6B methylase 2